MTYMLIKKPPNNKKPKPNQLTKQVSNKWENKPQMKHKPRKHQPCHVFFVLFGMFVNKHDIIQKKQQNLFIP